MKARSKHNVIKLVYHEENHRKNVLLKINTTNLCNSFQVILFALQYCTLKQFNKLINSLIPLKTLNREFIRSFLHLLLATIRTRSTRCLLEIKLILCFSILLICGFCMGFCAARQGTHPHPDTETILKSICEDKVLFSTTLSSAYLMFRTRLTPHSAT